MSNQFRGGGLDPALHNAAVISGAVLAAGVLGITIASHTAKQSELADYHNHPTSGYEAASAQPNSKIPANVIEASRAVVSLLPEPEKANYRKAVRGNATLVAGDMLLTNRHVIEALYVKEKDGTRRPVRVGDTVMAYFQVEEEDYLSPAVVGALSDDSTDYAVLLVGPEVYNKLGVVALRPPSGYRPRIESDVYLVGRGGDQFIKKAKVTSAPFGTFLATIKFRNNRELKLPYDQLIFLESPVNLGESGSAVLDKNGNLVGTVVATSAANTHSIALNQSNYEAWIKRREKELADGK